MKPVAFVLVAAVAAALAPTARAQVIYTITDIGTLPGDDTSFAFAVNNSGQVTGESLVQGTSMQKHAFRWSAATGMADISAGLNSGGFAINDSGQVAGVYNAAGGTTPRISNVGDRFIGRSIGRSRPAGRIHRSGSHGHQRERTGCGL